ncbi:MAG: lipoprotein insertase outer membrane protein LolB [Gammaproteobacteria bacterium]
MRIFFLGLVFFVISGCANLNLPLPKLTTESPVFDQWEAHKIHISELKYWRMNSRAFIQSKDDGFASSIRWKQQDQLYDIRFTAPFSQGLYHLSGAPENVSILLPDGTEQTAIDPETLMNKTLGFKFPVSGLGYWLRGLPYPEDPGRDIVLDSNERLAELKQAGWDIKISKYIHKDGYYLPTKLTIENSHLKIKMAVSEWITSE